MLYSGKDSMYPSLTTLIIFSLLGLALNPKVNLSFILQPTNKKANNKILTSSKLIFLIFSS